MNPHQHARARTRPALQPWHAWLLAALLLTAQAAQAVVLNEAQPFNCVRCGQPFGTKQMIDSMMGRLGAHSMFAGGGALRRTRGRGARGRDALHHRGDEAHERD